MTTPISGPSTSPPPQRQTNSFAVASFVLGVVGIFAGIASILATVFGGIAIKQIRHDPNLGGHRLAVAGLVLGIVGIVIWLAIIALVIIFVMALRTLTF